MKLPEFEGVEFGELKIIPTKTLRDEFAMAALKGISGHNEFGHNSFEWIAKTAYEQADAMMAAREGKTNAE